MNRKGNLMNRTLCAAALILTVCISVATMSAQVQTTKPATKSADVTKESASKSAKTETNKLKNVARIQFDGGSCELLELTTLIEQIAWQSAFKTQKDS